MSKLEEDIVLLKNIPMFAKLDTAKLKLLAFCSSRVIHEAGEILFRQGDLADSAYIISEGTAEVIVEPDDGDDGSETEYGRNKIFGDMALLSGTPHDATLRAKTRLVCLKIEKEHFLSMLMESAPIMMDIMNTLVRQLADATGPGRGQHGTCPHCHHVGA